MQPTSRCRRYLRAKTWRAQKVIILTAVILKLGFDHTTTNFKFVLTVTEYCNWAKRVNKLQLYTHVRLALIIFHSYSNLIDRTVNGSHKSDSARFQKQHRHHIEKLLWNSVKLKIRPLFIQLKRIAPTCERNIFTLYPAKCSPQIGFGKSIR